MSIDEKHVEYFPELAGRIKNAEKITLRQMVHYQSGIPNFTDNSKFWEHPLNSSEGALEFALDLPTTFEPDEYYGYSSTIYLLLREIIKKVVGYNHFEYIMEEILIPLALNQTFGSINEVNLDDVMSGY